MANDKRAAQTEHKIEEALTVLINQKGFNNISVTDITREAKISRGTFYIHYLDKVDLLNHVEDNLLQKLQKILEEVIPRAIEQQRDGAWEVPYKAVISTLNQFLVDRELIIALLSTRGDPAFLTRVKDLFSQEIHRDINSYQGTISYDNNIPPDYIEEIVLNALMGGIVLHWLSKDQPESPDEVAQIIMYYCETAPKEWITID
ncbi:TetR/AcrR family transcriptional regulator [Lentilactobacillus senioris]|uniref:TetR/AcrR family transcriptional regulator n=1 Tax=Lentilactobacillus senioris TaxID=931534 RepID=UPI0006CF569F|nr:TetR/AcrR family transcriptional regulator [Lentilactobacillus senioris]